MCQRSPALDIGESCRLGRLFKTPILSIALPAIASAPDASRPGEAPRGSHGWDPQRISQFRDASEDVRPSPSIYVGSFAITSRRSELWQGLIRQSRRLLTPRRGTCGR
jgi:hypothetical protein